MNSPSSPQDWAWLAGLYEGEGNITLSRKNLRLTITMCDEDIIRRAQEVAGGHVYGPYSYKARDGSIRKPTWRWTVSRREDVLYVIGKITPFLGERRSRSSLNSTLSSD